MSRSRIFQSSAAKADGKVEISVGNDSPSPTHPTPVDSPVDPSHCADFCVSLTLAWPSRAGGIPHAGLSHF